MKLIMENFRNTMKEGFELDKNKDGELSSTALRDMAAQLDRNKGAKLAGSAQKSDVALQSVVSKFEDQLRDQQMGLSTTFYPSVMYRILRSGNMDGTPGNEENGVDAAVDYFMRGVQGGDASGLEDALRADLEDVKQTIDLENEEGKGGTGPNFEPSPFGGAKPRAFVNESFDMSPVNAAIDNITEGLNTLQDSEFMSVLSFAQREEIMEIQTKIAALDRIAQGQSSM